MSVPPDTPVLVGAAAAARLPDAIELTAAAAEAAALDAGVPGLLGHVDRVYVARGSWTDPNPGRPIATRFGAAKVHSVVAELGVLQQTLVTRGCLDVAAGRADVVLVLGAEAAHSTGGVRLTAGRLGAEGRGGWSDTGPDGAGPDGAGPDGAGPDRAGPDEVLAPSDDILHRAGGAARPVPAGLAVAVLESALRAAGGLGLAAHAAEVAELWAGFSRVAAGNEDAWARNPVTPADLAASDRNPMMSWPYTRSHCSRAGVDQGAALLLCSARTALRLGVPRDRWVFPVAAAESNVMTPVSARPDLARSPGFAAVGRRLTEVTGVAPVDADLVDLYSCFPAAVRLQLRELGLAGRADLTVTGGMTFAGGPLNNYAFQSTVKMAEQLRAAESGAHGLVTCVSGMVTKQGGLLWSTAPPPAGFRAEDVSAEVRAAQTPLPLVEDVPVGRGQVVGFTVACEKGEPTRALAVVTLADGSRTVATSTTPDLVAAMTTEEWVGRTVTIDGGALVR